MYEQEFVNSLYIQLYRIRHFETECIKLYRQGLIRGYFHPYLGEEAIAVGTCAALEPSDYITSTHRGHGHCIAKGAELKYMVAELLGKKTGYCFGLGGSMHIADLSKGNLGANAIVGANVPLGVGAALASSLIQNHRVTAVFTSDGGSNNGVFAESLNLAAIWNLPMILVLENNQYAVSTPISESTRQPELYKRGQALGIDSMRIDGNDVFKVFEKIKQSAKKCRQGKGPVLIEMLTYRHGGHHVNDPGTYMPREKLDYFLSIDPVKRCKTYLLETVGVTEQDIADIESGIHKEMQDAIEFAKKSEELSQEEFLELIQDY
ncbi:pyruvate dehydrogenase (acetyl-transferring) E1 component subunit alpha [candidate division KSB1 bacterium]|nr:pyruvate dehydrogenase (acetyl-transferring) E1 component subunit alpha [candidate division KSB1 bacterium]